MLRLRQIIFVALVISSAEVLCVTRVSILCFWICVDTLQDRNCVLRGFDE